MSRGINKAILIGNCGSDPETRYLPNGNAVTNVTIATTDSWKDKQTGQLQERTEWHRITFFGKVAEIAGEYLRLHARGPQPSWKPSPREYVSMLVRWARDRHYRHIKAGMTGQQELPL